MEAVPPRAYFPVETFKTWRKPCEFPATTKLLFAGTKAQHKTSDRNWSLTVLKQLSFESDRRHQSLMDVSNEEETMRSLLVLQLMAVMPFAWARINATTFGGLLIASQIDIDPSREAQQNLDGSLFANLTIEIAALCWSNTWWTPAKLLELVACFVSGFVSGFWWCFSDWRLTVSVESPYLFWSSSERSLMYCACSSGLLHCFFLSSWFRRRMYKIPKT